MSQIIFHVAFPLSEAVKTRAFSIIETLREAERPRDHVPELTDVIIAMTEEGLKYLFIDSLKAAHASAFHIQAVQVGVNTARKGLEMVGRRALQRFSDETLRGIADYMEEVLLPVEVSEVPA
ncbi:MAG: hypothetical protein D6722_03865 [Bacteroidetes bacterium]|nr:MAG: hypothetical protein D6722_03865 [Bacteroidota bacterium]